LREFWGIGQYIRFHLKKSRQSPTLREWPGEMGDNPEGMAARAEVEGGQQSQCLALVPSPSGDSQASKGEMLVGRRMRVATRTSGR
jgi:hypothetical protein